MPTSMLIALFDQAERLCDDLYEIAVVAADNPQDAKFTRVCRILDKGLERRERRMVKADLIFR